MATLRGAFCSVVLWQGVLVGAVNQNGKEGTILIEVKADGNLENVPVVSGDPVIRASDSEESVPGIFKQDEAEDEDHDLVLAQKDELVGRLQAESANQDEALVQRDATMNEMQAKIKDLEGRIMTAQENEDVCNAQCDAKCDASCGDGATKELGTCKPCDCPVGWQPLSSLPKNCKDTTCEKGECCEELGMCKACDCPDGWKLLSSLPANCKDTTCTKGECCEKLGTTTTTTTTETTTTTTTPTTTSTASTTTTSTTTMSTTTTTTGNTTVVYAAQLLNRLGSAFGF